ncbi:RNA polymerase sigma factor [Rubrivirga sp.]|uniref:RNA polymerase sigma factor n=1 Tax=Rubrivirga sp. TaxID=1885344 RepID=UPI003C729FEA
MSTAPPNAETWRRALTGDRDAFNEALSPHTDTLRGAAERQLEVERDPITDAPDPGQKIVDLTPDELVGETMVRAWDLRERFDADRMSFRAWLLGLQTRSLARITQRQDRYARRKAISLDQEIPTNETQDAVGEQFYEFRQPFDVDTYEEIIASTTPDDPAPDGFSLDGESRAEARQGALLFDEFDVSLAEVAQILDASLKDTAASMNLAREGLRARIGSVEDAHDDAPATDSYTGDPLPDA